MEYQILKSNNYMHLAKIVQDAIDNGWKPLGGIGVIFVPNVGEVFYQALTRQ